MSTDEMDIRALLRGREDAVRRGDATGALAGLAESVAIFDLPPPLAYRDAEAHDAEGLNAWFATWNGPVEATLHHETILVGGDMAVVYGFQHMRGEKKGEGPLDQWSRITTVLRRLTEGWRIVHEHVSFPLMMDGSGRAATSLMP